MSRNKGRDFLFSNDGGFINGDDGESYRYSDGSGYYHGNDGSEGYVYSDGSAYYKGADGSEGYIYSDGSGYYKGADGSDGYKYSDGSGYYKGADGSDGYKYSDGSGYYNDADSSVKSYDSSGGENIQNNSKESFATDIITTLFGLGVVAVGTALKKQEAEFRERWEAEEKEREEREKIKKERQKKFFKKHWKAILILIGVLLFSGVIIFLLFQYKKLTSIGISSYEVIGRNYKEVQEKLYNNGFNNIITEALGDLGIDELGQENIVAEIIVSGDDTFEETKKYPYDVEIKIVYHTAKTVKTPMSVKDAKGKKYKEIVEQFEKAGFVNIILVAEYDLVFGWLNEENEIVSITINNDKKFKSDTAYRVDAEVVITYHAYKKNKKD